jgi:hypothetical protein
MRSPAVQPSDTQAPVGCGSALDEARTALMVTLTGWLRAKGCSQPRMMPAGRQGGLP